MNDVVQEFQAILHQEAHLMQIELVLFMLTLAYTIIKMTYFLYMTQGPILCGLFFFLVYKMFIVVDMDHAGERQQQQ